MSVGCLNGERTTRPPRGSKVHCMRKVTDDASTLFRRFGLQLPLVRFSGIAGCRKLDAGEAQGNQWGVLRLDGRASRPRPRPESGQGHSRPGSHGSSMGPLKAPFWIPPSGAS